MFWQLTIDELDAVFDAETKRRRAEAHAADMRAGLVAATFVNVFRKKGARPLQPSDFIAGPHQYMSVKEAQRALTIWATGINRGLKQPAEDNA